MRTWSEAKASCEEEGQHLITFPTLQAFEWFEMKINDVSSLAAAAGKIMSMFSQYQIL